MRCRRAVRNVRSTSPAVVVIGSTWVGVMWSAALRLRCFTIADVQYHCPCLIVDSAPGWPQCARVSHAACHARLAPPRCAKIRLDLYRSIDSWMVRTQYTCRRSCVAIILLVTHGRADVSAAHFMHGLPKSCKHSHECTGDVQVSAPEATLAASAAVATLLCAAPALADFPSPPPEIQQAAKPAQSQSLSFPSAEAPAPATTSSSGLPEGNQWRYSDFISAVENGKVERVRFSKDGAQLQLTAVDGRRAQVLHWTSTITSLRPVHE